MLHPPSGLESGNIIPKNGEPLFVLAMHLFGNFVPVLGKESGNGANMVSWDEDIPAVSRGS
jgi:hypothetical protein